MDISAEVRTFTADPSHHSAQKLVNKADRVCRLEEMPPETRRAYLLALVHLRKLNASPKIFRVLDKLSFTSAPPTRPFPVGPYLRYVLERSSGKFMVMKWAADELVDSKDKFWAEVAVDLCSFFGQRKNNTLSEEEGRRIVEIVAKAQTRCHKRSSSGCLLVVKSRFRQGVGSRYYCGSSREWAEKTIENTISCFAIDSSSAVN